MTTPCRAINANAIAAPSPSGMIFHGCRDFLPIDVRLIKSSSRGLKLSSTTTTTTTSLAWSFRSPGRFLSPHVASASASEDVTSNSANRFEALEKGIEKGCMYVVDSFAQYSVDPGKLFVDTYLLGIVILVFGMRLYELFISNLNTLESISYDNASNRSSLFGMFPLKERPQWLELTSVSELKMKIR